MITKTEVQSVIERCAPHAGFATIDNALVHPGAVSRGDLFALIEAAKCARYRNAYTGMEQKTGVSNSHLVLHDT